MFVFFMAVSSQSTCRKQTNKGKNFIVAVPSAWSGSGHDRPFYKMYLAAEKETRVHIRSKIINDDRIIQGNSVTDYNIDETLTHTPSNASIGFISHSNKTIHVTADQDVAVYIIGSGVSTSTAASFIVYPTESFSTAFLVGSYIPESSYKYSQIIITTVYPDTYGYIEKNNASTIYQFSGKHSFNLYGNTDFTGTAINASRPISVVVSTDCAEIPYGYPGCDQLSYSVIPTDGWGREYIIPPLYPTTNYLVRVIVKDTTLVHFYNTTHFISTYIHWSKAFELLLGTEPLVITAERPVMVVQYGLSQSFDGITGDAFMTNVPALKNFASNFVFPSPPSLWNVSYYNTIGITIKQNDASGLRLDGVPLQNAIYFNVTYPLSDYVVIIANLTGSSHTLTHNNISVTYAALVYGRANFQAYGFPAGLTILSDGKCSSPVCFSCEDLISLKYCTSVENCAQNEICYASRYKNHLGHIRYRSGCLHKQICDRAVQYSYKQETNTLTNAPSDCLQCCSQDFCNSAACNDTGFPAPESRGPICFDCIHISNASECDEVVPCSMNQACSIEEYRWFGSEHMFSLGCKDKLTCALETGSFQERSIPVCRSCCTDDFCNKNCTRSDAVVPIIDD